LVKHKINKSIQLFRLTLKKGIYMEIGNTHKKHLLGFTLMKGFDIKIGYTHKKK